MLFRKYQIIVLSPNQDKQRTFSMRAFWLVLAFALFLVLGMGNYGFWQYYKATHSLPQALNNAEERLESQRIQVLALAKKAQHLEDDLARVQQFDASLRMMLDVTSSVPLEVHGDDVESAGDAVHSQNSNSEGHTDDGASSVTSPSGLPKISNDAIRLGLGTLPLHRQELLTRKIHAFLDTLHSSVLLEEVHQQELIKAMRAQQGILAATPSIWPTKGKLTSRFGWRIAPTTGASTFHKGIDIGKNNGAPIVAPADGTVTFAGRQSGYGNCVEIRHANGITTMYAHMKSYTVTRGQKVKRSDVIGYVGSTGRSTGPHLHYEVRVNGVPVDPMKYILH